MIIGNLSASNALDETNKSINVKLKSNKNDTYWTIEAPPPMGKKATVDAINVYEIICDKKPTGVILFSKDQANAFIQTALNDQKLEESITRRAKAMKPINLCYSNIKAIKDNFIGGGYRSRWVKKDESFQADIENRLDNFLKACKGETDTGRVSKILDDLINKIDGRLKEKRVDKSSYSDLKRGLKQTKERFKRSAARGEKLEVVQEKRRSFSK